MFCLGRACTTARSNFVRPVLFFSGISIATATTYYSITRPSSHAAALPLGPSHFTPTTLIESVDVSSNTKLLTLSVSPELLPPDRDTFKPVWSIFIKDSDIQVERPYTPLEGIDENGHVKLWIKKYEHGEVGRWLHTRQVGDSIEIRGPVQTWSRLWQNGHWDEVVMVSGGTGITPFYQLLHSIFRAQDTPFNTRFTLLHGCRSSADLPPAGIIRSLTTLSQKYPDRFQFQLFANSINDISENHSINVQHGRIGKSALQDALRLTRNTSWWCQLSGISTPALLTPEKRVLVLVCGPEGMVSAIAGPYGRNYSQGEVGGILRELGLQSHQVWKL